ncbi:hypothetical protein IPG36_06265 [bacterium]|nr:MAG: hypothetical protein IPG36_06265 [bacterium]
MMIGVPHYVSITDSRYGRRYEVGKPDYLYKVPILSIQRFKLYYLVSITGGGSYQIPVYAVENFTIFYQ